MTGILILAGYAILMIGSTVIFTKRAESAESFHVADRNLGTVMSAMSIAATWIWAPALFVSAEQAYTNGIPGFFWFLVPNVLCLLLFIPFAKRIRAQMPQGITLSGYMAEKYKSQKVKKVYLFQLSSLSVLSTSVQLLAGGKMMSLITGLPFPLLTVLLAAIAFSYSQFSGIRAAVATDAVQLLLILGGCALIVPWMLNSTGGIDTLLAGLGGRSRELRSLFDGNGLQVFLSFGLPTAIGLISGPFGDQSFWQRSFAIKKRSIGKAFALGAVLFALVPISIGCIGYLAAGSGFQAIDPSMVNFEFITHLLPTWVLVPFLFMVLSGLLSTVDSNLCSVASLTTDREKKETGKENIKTSRIVMVGLLVLAIAIANVPGLTVTHLFLFYGTLRASTLLPTVMTLFGKKLSARGVYVGVLCSLIVGLPIFAYGSLSGRPLFKTLGSLISMLAAGVVAAVMTKMEVKQHARSKAENKQ